MSLELLMNVFWQNFFTRIELIANFLCMLKASRSKHFPAIYNETAHRQRLTSYFSEIREKPARPKLYSDNDSSLTDSSFLGVKSQTTRQTGGLNTAYKARFPSRDLSPGFH